MANRRMFSKRITESTRFIKMPVSTQNLYFHLGMHADDDGIVEAYPIMCMIGATEDDLKVLVNKEFVTVLNSDYVTFLNDWLENNNIRADRKVDSIYSDLLLKVLPDVDIKESRKSSFERKKEICQTNDSQQTENSQPNDGLGKDRLGKVSIGKDRIDNNIVSKDTIRSTDVQRTMDTWNHLGISQVTKLNPNTKRYKMLKARIKEYGIEKVIEAIESINHSSFLKGQNNKAWMITFDWFVMPNNFIKVLDGNYLDRGTPTQEKKELQTEEYWE